MGPGRLLFQLNIIRNKYKSQSDRNWDIKSPFREKKKKKGLKIKYKRFSVPGEYKPVYNTNRFFCCTVHFRTMLTLTMLIPWPEAALDSDTWLFRNKHFCLRIIQISCLLRLIWAQFSCCWNLLSSQLPVLWVHNPSPQPVHFSPSSSQVLEAHTVLTMQTQLLQYNPEKLRHSFCSSCCKPRFLLWDAYMTVAPWEC